MHEARRRLKLSPELTDGDHFAIVTSYRDIDLSAFMGGAEVGQTATITLVEMTDAEVEALTSERQSGYHSGEMDMFDPCKQCRRGSCNGCAYDEARKELKAWQWKCSDALAALSAVDLAVAEYKSKEAKAKAEGSR